MTVVLTTIQKAALHLETALFGSNDAAQIAENMISRVVSERLQESAQRRLSPVELAVNGLMRIWED